MKLGTFVELPDVMNRDNFRLRLMSSLRAGGMSERGFAFEMHGSYDIALRYRAGQVIKYTFAVCDEQLISL
jgi:hypothetical protein